MTFVLSDIIAQQNEIAPIVTQQTIQKLDFLGSSALFNNPVLQNRLLTATSQTIEVPFYNAITYTAPLKPNSSTKSPLVPGGAAWADSLRVTQEKEIAVRAYGVQQFSSMAFTIARNLQHKQPLDAVVEQLSAYWSIVILKAVMSTLAGVFADNDAAPDGTEHVQGDMTFDVSNTAGGSYDAAVTSIVSQNGANVNTARLTMGEQMHDLRVLLLHPDVYTRLLNNNLLSNTSIVQNSEAFSYGGLFGGNIAVYFSNEVPKSGSVYTSYLLGEGALQYAFAPTDRSVDGMIATEFYNDPGAGNGAGQDFLFSRNKWVTHPTGYRYIGTPAEAGPDIGTGSNNLGNAGSWKRVYKERGRVRLARLITREA